MPYDRLRNKAGTILARFRFVLERTQGLLAAPSSPRHRYRVVELPDEPVLDFSFKQKLDIAIVMYLYSIEILPLPSTSHPLIDGWDAFRFSSTHRVSLSSAGQMLPSLHCLCPLSTVLRRTRGSKFSAFFWNYCGRPVVVHSTTASASSAVAAGRLLAEQL